MVCNSEFFCCDDNDNNPDKLDAVRATPPKEFQPPREHPPEMAHDAEEAVAVTPDVPQDVPYEDGTYYEQVKIYFFAPHTDEPAVAEKPLPEEPEPAEEPSFFSFAW